MIRLLTIMFGFAVAAGLARAETDCKAGGFAGERVTYAPVWVHAPLPPQRAPEVRSLTELNLETRCKGESWLVSGDFTGMVEADGRHRSVGPDGHAQRDGVPYEDRVRSSLATNEAYATKDIDGGPSLTLGKKRVVWGSGFSFNPTDLVNPAKDPTEPKTQRTGTWLGQAELPFATQTVSLLFSPQVVSRKGGMPIKAYEYTDESTNEQDLHYIAAARYYALVAGADVNLMAYHTQLYQDGFEHKMRYGISASRFFGGLGLHFEALLGKGSDRYYPDPECSKDEPAVQGCVFRGRVPVTQSRLEDGRIYPRILVGTRYHFEDNAQLVVEVLHQNDGYTKDEFSDLVEVAAYTQRNTGLSADDSLAGGATGLGPVMKNYLAVHYGDWKLTDDVGLSASVLGNLQHGSGFAGPGANWSATESFHVSVRVLELVTTGEGTKIPGSPYSTTETELARVRRSVILQLKAFY